MPVWLTGSGHKFEEILNCVFLFFFQDTEIKYNQLCQRLSEETATDTEENKGSAASVLPAGGSVLCCHYKCPKRAFIS